MNKSQLYTLSGALLASTALIGTANAGTVGRAGANIVTTGAISTTATRIANTLFSTTTATADAKNFNGDGVNPIAINFANNFSAATRFNATINIAGAQFNNPAVNVAVLGRHTGGTFVGTVTGACGAVTPLVDKILLSTCQLSNAAGLSATLGNTAAIGAFAGGLQLSGVVFKGGSALATAGNSITLSGTLNDNANPVILLENISSGAVVTSAAPIATTITAGTTAVTNAATTPAAFRSLSQPNIGQLSVNLATVVITGTGALGTDLQTAVTPDGGAGQGAATTVTITVTSATLTDDATVSATRANGVLTTTLTPAAFSSGTATFSLTAANQFDVAANTQTINVQFNGTSAINAAAAGTVAVAYGGATALGHAQAPASASGTTAAINSGGFSAEFNTAQASGSDYQSFVRIHNNGSTAGTVTITVLNDATGANMGSYTTGSIAVGQTLQVSMPTIEAGAGITSPSGQYTLQIAGPILGYAQHVLFNATTGQFSNLSAFRNAGSATNVP